MTQSNAYGSSPANKPARITGDTRATLVEDSPHNIARGDLDVCDVDRGQNQVQAIQNQTGTYGKFSINADGQWTYVLNNSLAAVQALGAGQKGTDSFVVRSKDGSASQTVVVTVNGVNDQARITGTATGVVTEGAANNAATGKLDVTDVDAGEAGVLAIRGKAGAYGTFSIQADGRWTYLLDNGSKKVEKLAEGETLTEKFTVFARDQGGGCDAVSKTVVITIRGSNDAAVIGGAISGAVAEDGTNRAQGQLTVKDIESGQASFQAQSDTTGSFGSFSINKSGKWVYTLDNANVGVQALGDGESAQDTFTVKTKDGTAQLITITIAGANDAASISGTTIGAVTEDSGSLIAAGTITVTDVDLGDAAVRVLTDVAGTYGAFSIDASGAWVYVLANDSAAVQALGAGDVAADSFTVTSRDGTATRQVVITITGAAESAAAPVANNDTVSRVITFDPGSYTQVTDTIGNAGRSPGDLGNIVTTNDGFQFSRDPSTGGFGTLVDVLIPSVYNSHLIYTYGRTDEDPGDIVLQRTDGLVFALQSATIFGDNNRLLDGAFETVTGYFHGQQVVQQSFHTPEAYTTSANQVDFTDIWWRSVDRVVFHVDINHTGIPPGTYFSNSHQIDNIQTLSSTAEAVNVNVLANDAVAASGDVLSIAAFSATSARGATISLNADGTLRYDPTTSAELIDLAIRQTQTDTFTYTTQDQHGNVSNVATATITIVGLADTPG